MVLDGISVDFSTFLDRDTDVMTSPVHLRCFYGCGSPPEAHLSAGSPNSDSEQSWSEASSPRNCASVEADSLRKLAHYQGVRVKNTVKELIMRRRHQDIQPQQYHVESEYPAITHVLQGQKRKAESPSFSPVKLLRLDDGNTLSPYDQIESLFCDSEILEDISAVLDTQRLSINSVMVRGCSVSDQQPLLSQHPNIESTPTVGPPVSFFQWQIQQEDDKLSAVSPLDLIAGDEDGDTFLHIAVAQGRRALAFVLARRMAAIDMLDMKEHNKQSAFQLSVAADQHLIAQDLLSLGAELNTLDCWGRSPLHVCAEKGHSSTLQAIQKSVQMSGRQVSVEVVDYDGLTPLHVAVLAHNAVVQELCCHGMQNLPLLQKRKLLADCISTLLLMGASLETKDRKSGRTALHMAAEEANVELLRLFLDQPNYYSFINAKAFSGNTALHMASALQGRQAQVDAVRLLLRRGADASIKNLENEQPVQLVPEGPLGEQVRRILKGKGAQWRS